MQMQSTQILKWVSSRDEYNFSKLYWKERIRTCAIQWSVSSTFHASCQTPFAKQHFHPISRPPPSTPASFPAASFSSKCLCQDAPGKVTEDTTAGSDGRTDLNPKLSSENTQSRPRMLDSKQSKDAGQQCSLLPSRFWSPGYRHQLGKLVCFPLTDA